MQLILISVDLQHQLILSITNLFDMPLEKESCRFAGPLACHGLGPE